MVSFVHAQGVEQMRTVEDQGPVEQFVAAGLDPPFHDRLHAGHSDTAEHDADSGVGEDLVELHRVRYGYPADIVERAGAEANWLRAAVGTGTEPFGSAYQPWLAMVDDAAGGVDGAAGGRPGHA